MQIGIIGAGNMAGALARGLGERVLCTDAGSGRAPSVGEPLSSNAELARRADLVILAHKPAQLEAVAAQCEGHARSVISLLGAVTLESLRAAYPHAQPLVRAMPNTAVEVRRGVTCLCGEDTQSAQALFERVGVVFEVPERNMDAATAVSGVAPAYVSLLAEAWVDAAVKHGLPAGQAAQLVLESLAGSTELLRARAMDTLAVRRAVTSPGGMTARGLAALESAGVRAAFLEAMAAVLR
ncbi:MAG: pyrroline-5-carboxylate reductase family protein [Solirubrobacteraceae bacterium]